MIDDQSDALTRQIEADTNYAIDYIGHYERFLDHFNLDVTKCTILELGPGHNFGPQLVMAERGAKVVLADLYLTGFGRPYHPAAYRALNEKLSVKSRLLEIAQDGYQDTPLILLNEPAEALRSLENESIDFVYSNAALEHVFDMSRVAYETARVMRTGAVAAHQVDLRYHFHDFQRPLDHLVVDDDLFLAEAVSSQWTCGNRLRSMEFIAHFEAAGLRVVQRETNMKCKPEYFVDAVKRLRSGNSSYKFWPIDDLERISARFYLVKGNHSESRETAARGADLLQLIEQIKRAAALTPFAR